MAAKPFLGQAGFLMIGLAALFSTASAINATLFGTARLGMVMAQEEALPKAFSLKEQQQDKLSLAWIAGCYLLVIMAELLYSERRLIFKASEHFLWRRRRLTYQLSPRNDATMSSDVNEYEPGVLRIFQTKDETKAYYNKIAKVYDLLAEDSEQPMREKGVQKLAAQPAERILEIGFGTGHSLVELAQAVGPNGTLLGVDISDKMVALTKDLLQRERLSERVELTCGDAEALPYEDNSLDGIFTSFTLELFDTPEIPKVLAEWKRVLKPGGRLVVVAISKEGKQGVIMKAYEWTHKHFPNLMDCRPIYARRAIEAASFEVKETDIEHMWVAVEIVLAVKR